MKKDPRVHLTFILESIELVENYLKAAGEADFQNDPKLQDAVIRRLEMIGEAVKNLPQEQKELKPEIPWKNISGMRDVLIHDYLGINLKITWKAAAVELPKLKAAVIELLNR